MIDCDFASSKRYEVIHMVREKYGEQNVAQVMTFGCLQSKAAIDAIGKVLGYDIPTKNEIKKKLKDGKRIDETLVNDKELMKEYRDLIIPCSRLEGMPRSTSLHAGGLVICPQGHEITEYAPLMLSKENELAVQCTKHTVEDVGLVKYDFLATSVLDIINDCIKDIGSSFYDFKWNYEDKDVWDYICTGQTDGMFQTESEFMTKIIMKVQPHNIEELCAVISLGRPDTKDEVDPYAAVKNGLEKPNYYDPLLESTLKETYGKMIYQETFMNIAKVYAGYSDGEADKLRKGLGKKDRTLVKIEADKFYQRAVDLGRPESTCRQLADILAEKGGYCFNKSHGIAYAIISYWTAYLKYHYPLDFMASMLNNQKKETGQVDYDDISKYINSCTEMGITIRHPDINITGNKFTVDKATNSIMFGFDLLKGTGKKCVRRVIKDRPYESFEDYMARTGIDLNKSDTIALIKSGSFNKLVNHSKHDLFKYFYSVRFNAGKDDVKPLTTVNKTQIKFILDNGLAKPDEVTDKSLMLKRINQYRKSQGWLEFKEKYMSGNELNWEMETLNTFLSGDPFENVILPNWEDLNIEESGTIGGVITYIKKVTIKNGRSAGKKMGFININTDYGVIDTVVFNKNWEEYEDILTVGNTIVVLGKKTDDFNCTLNSVETLEKYLIRTNYLYKENYEED